MIPPRTSPVVLCQDGHFVAVHKPAGLLVHRGMGAQAGEEFLLQLVRDIVGLKLYPVHRLDRPTSGIVLFGLSSADAGALQKSWRASDVHKTYQAIVRGWMPEPAGLHDEALDHPETGVLQEASTRWSELARCEVAIPVSRYSAMRCSLLQLEPLNGRWHQLRRHMSRLHHPILGDTTHGCRHHNHTLQAHFGWWQLMLSAVHMTFPHPATGAPVHIDLPDELNDVKEYWRQLANSSWDSVVMIKK